MDLLRRLPFFAAVLIVLQAVCLSARADTDAFSFPASTIVPETGYFEDGVGWSFEVKTNLSVTWVGYENNYSGMGWITTATITFWTSTNTPLVAYSTNSIVGPVEQDTNRVLYGKIAPLFLTAGKEYFVTLDFGSNSAVVVEAFSTDLTNVEVRPLLTAPEIAPSGIYDYNVGAGSLKPSVQPSGLVLLGPAFRFQASTVALPPLEIRVSVGGSQVIAWPTNFTGFTLQSTTNLVSPVWTSNSLAPVVVNGQNTVTNPISGTQQFFRLSQ
jgi:hypothetical protein